MDLLDDYVKVGKIRLPLEKGKPNNTKAELRTLLNKFSGVNGHHITKPEEIADMFSIKIVDKVMFSINDPRWHSKLVYIWAKAFGF